MKKTITITSTDSAGVSHSQRVHGSMELVGEVIRALSLVGHKNFEIEES